MRSSVLRNEPATIVNAAIMLTFVRLRQILATDKELPNGSTRPRRNQPAI